MRCITLFVFILFAAIVYSQEDPFMEVTYKNATLVNTSTNIIECNTKGQFYIVFFLHVVCYVEGGVVDRYSIIDSRDDDLGVTMILRNDNNQKCGLRYEKDKLTITNAVTHKSVILTEPYYHSSENDMKFESYPNKETLHINYSISYKINKYDIRYDIQNVSINLKIDFKSKYLVMIEGDSEAHYNIKDVKSNEQYITFYMYNNNGYTVASIDRKDYTLCMTSTKQDPIFLITNKYK